MDRSASARVGAAAAAGLVTAATIRRRIRARSDLRGAVALVTGSSRGLGLAIARELADRGCRLALTALDPDRLERARRDLEGRGAEAMAEPADVGDRAEVERLVAAVTGRYGRIDVLVNNAGIISVGPLATQRVEDFDHCLHVMYWGVVLPTLAALPGMLERDDGRVVNVTSIGGKLSFPHLLPYSSAKFAAVGFSEGLRAELAGTGVSVTTVVPGLMRTGSHVNALFNGRHRAEFAWFALGATLPGVSLPPERAARRIVDAAALRRPEVILSPQAKLAARAAAVAPATTGRLLGVVARLLPSDDGASDRPRRGSESHSAVTTSPLTRLGERSARRLNQYPTVAES